jgi:hypothetical protein
VCGGDENGDDSEVNCIIDCMVTLDDLDACVGQCVASISSPVCSAGTISGATNELVGCVAGDADGLGGCYEECFTEFDEDSCLY